MTILNRLYASSGSEVIFLTLQITIGDENYYLTQGWDDITAKLEDGTTEKFYACGVSIALPARNADGTQDLKFAISNITGEISSMIRESLKNNEASYLTFRCYTSNDLSGPAEVPYTLDIKSGYWTAPEVQVTAGYMNILDTAWPRFRYTLSNHPGLRYLS